MERKVIRIITPGTVSDEALLSERQDNLIAAVYHDGRRFGYGTMDIGSGRFFINQFEKEETLLAELQRTNPAELLYPESFAFLHHVEGVAAVCAAARSGSSSSAPPASSCASSSAPRIWWALGSSRARPPCAPPAA